MSSTALLVFPNGDPGLDAVESACTSAGWTGERSSQPALALVRLIRPATGLPTIGLIIASASAGGLGAVGLVKAARSHATHRDLPLIMVGAGILPADLPQACLVAAGDGPGIAAAIARLSAPAPAAAPSPVATDEELLDREAIGMLTSLPGVWARTFTAYARDLSTQLDELDRIPPTGDLPHLHRVAHTLKGSSGSIGARTLHQALTRLDQAAVQGDTARIATLLPTIRPLAERSLAALRRIQA